MRCARMEKPSSTGLLARLRMLLPPHLRLAPLARSAVVLGPLTLALWALGLGHAAAQPSGQLSEQIDGVEITRPGPGTRALLAALPADALPQGSVIRGEALAVRWAEAPLGPDVHHYTAEIDLTVEIPEGETLHLTAAGQGNHFQAPFAARRALKDAGRRAAALLQTKVESAGILTRGVRPAGAKAPAISATPGPLYPRSVAVIIGVNRYPHISRQLEAAESDARRMARFLKAQGFQVHTLLGAQATRQRITALIGDALPKMVSAGDRVVIYFAGHGLTEGSGPSTLGYLAARDTEEGRPRATGISMLTLQRWLAHLPARHVLLLTDACYAGLAIASRAGPPLQGVAAPRWLRLALEGQVRMTLVAGRRGEQAHEIDGEGVFSAAVLEGLRGAADLNQDGFITGDELAVYVKPRVTERVLRAVNIPQRPQYARSGEGELIFRVPGPR